MEYIGMDQISWKLPFLAAFWISTSVCSGKDMESYGGFEILDIRWNGWFITMLMEVPAVFRREQNHNLVLKTAAVETLWTHLDYMCVCVCSCDMIRVRMSMCWTCMCMSCCPLGSTECPQYVMFIMDYRPSWALSMTVIVRLMNIHVLFVHFMHWLQYSQLIDQLQCNTLTAEPWITIKKSACMYMTHRQIEYYREGPRRAIVHD